MRNEKEIREELGKIKKVISLPVTSNDGIRLHHINNTLRWVLDLGYANPSSFGFDDIKKFEAAWKPERRVKDRRSLYPRSDGRRHNVDRRSL